MHIKRWAWPNNKSKTNKGAVARGAAAFGWELPAALNGEGQALRSGTGETLQGPSSVLRSQGADG